MFRELEDLEKETDFLTIVKSSYYRKNFREIYPINIPLASKALFDIELTWQQKYICDTHNFIGGRTAVSSGHGTGKTQLIAILAITYLLSYPQSIIRIQAPKKEQVTKFSFKEIKKALEKLLNVRKHNGQRKSSRWAFLAKFIEITATKIYVKGYSTSWYIESATAPKGSPANLSGQHADYYLLIFDEASGIDDDAIAHSLGGLSQEHNSAICFSQHTRNVGKFNEFMTTKSIESGGTWQTIRLNSEESPIVSIKSIQEWKSTYNDAEYDVKVLGLSPPEEGDYLIDTDEVKKCFIKKGKKWLAKFQFDNVAISSDVAYSGNSDKGVITVSYVYVTKNQITGKKEIYYWIKEVRIPKVRATKSAKKALRYLMPIELMNYLVTNVLPAYADKVPNIKVVVDSSAGGKEASVDLKKMIKKYNATFKKRIKAYGLAWGSQRMQKADKLLYANYRAKCHSEMAQAIKSDRVYIERLDCQQDIITEVGKIPFSRSGDNFKLKIMSKEDMKKNSIRSPDISDTIMQLAHLKFKPITKTKYNHEKDEPDDDFEEQILEDADDFFLDIPDDEIETPKKPPPTAKLV